MATSTIKQVTNNSGSGYCKMPDGTLIQWGSVSITTGTSKVSLGYPGQKQITYPIAFNSTPVIVANVYEAAGYWNGSVANCNIQGALITLAGNLPSVTQTVAWLAIGRWK